MTIESGRSDPAQDFWSCLAVMETGAGLMADWARQAGGALPWVRPFLLPGCEEAEHHPCRAQPECGCRHAVRQTSRGLVAVCTCAPGMCELFRVEPVDLVVYHLDRIKLGCALREALGLTPPLNKIRPPAGWLEVGTCEALGLPAWLAIDATETTLTRALCECDQETRGCILLTPGDLPACVELEDAFKRNGVFHMPLSQIIEPGPAGVLRARMELKQVLAPLIENSRRLRRAGPMLEAVHREIAALRTALDQRPNSPEPLPESVASQVFAMVRAMDEVGQKRKAPMLQVFRLYCEEGLTAAKIARKLNCAKSLVLLRLAALEKRIGRRPSELRALAGHFDRLEKTVDDPRARKIYRGC